MSVADVLQRARVQPPADRGPSTAAGGRRLDDATRVLRAAVANGGLVADETAQLRVALSWNLLMRGFPRRALAEADALIGEAGLSQPSYAAAHSARVMSLLAAGECTAARQSAELLLAGDASPGADQSLVAGLVTLGSLAQIEGRVTDSQLFLRAAVARADRSELPGPGMHPRQTLAASFIALGDFDEAETLLDRERAEIDRDDAAWAIGTSVTRSRLRLAQGRLDLAKADAERAIRLADLTGARLFVPLARLTLASVHQHQGDVRGAAAHLNRCRHEPPVEHGHFLSGLRAAIQSHITAAEHGEVKAGETLAEIYENPLAYRRVLVEEPPLAAFMVRCALAASDRAKAQAMEACTAQLAFDNSNHRVIEAIALHTRGVLHGDPVALTHAAHQYAHTWARACAFEDAGVVYAASGDRAHAHGSMEAALDVYRRADATHHIARLHYALGEARSRPQRARRLAHVVSGWGSLTDTERRVAGEVVRGQTNGEIAKHMYLSRHTVDFHLRQVFLKLGVHSRVELTRLAMEEDPLLCW